ncbi:MAG: hypothetical protein ACIARQ_06620 [Phycisphaerales bacterium JB061]
MPQWLELTLVIIGLVVVVVAGMSVLHYLSVKGMSKATLKPVDPAEIPDQIERSKPDSQWANKHGFTWAGSYTFKAGMNPAITVLAWRSQDRATFFCVYYAMNLQFYDLVTAFEKHIAITTGSMKDGVLFPHPPGEFIQVFPGDDLEERYIKHLESVRFIQSRFSISPNPISDELTDEFIPVVHRQMRYIRSIPLWIIRVHWWFITQRLRKNKTIEQQHPDLDTGDLHEIRRLISEEFDESV